MALRWCAAGMLEAKKQFRRVNGHLHLKALRTALDAHVASDVTTPDPTLQKRRWPHSPTAGAVTEIPRRSGHPPAGPIRGPLQPPSCYLSLRSQNLCLSSQTPPSQ